jgi:predicted dehydrogenase
MSHNEAETPQSPDFNRRDFVKGATFSSLMLLMGGIPIHAAESTPKDTGFSPDSKPINIGVIGCGLRGREILQTLPLVINDPRDGKPGTLITPTVAVCDSFPSALRRAKALAPDATAYDDYHKLLENKDVQAVIIATPTHLHREIVEAALKAGKHVYCEAPIAHTVDEARAIAKAAKAAERIYFQSGLQMRADPAKSYILSQFCKNGAIGTPVSARSQWHKKQTWRRATSDPSRDKAVNWQLDKAVSTGLVGEMGIHEIDLVNWFFGQLPTKATGFGGIVNPDCRDGREVPDTVQTILQYPNQANFSLDCSIATSFDRQYSMVYGNFGTIMMRESKGWLFQEIDSPLLGWEIYATKEQILKETGITLSADATKSVKTGKSGTESPYADTPLHHALKAFGINSYHTGVLVGNFLKAYGDDADGLVEFLVKPDNNPSTVHKPAAGYKEGLEATIIAIKANEAVMTGQHVAIAKDLFEI